MYNNQLSLYFLQYKATDYVVRGAGKFTISFEPVNGDKKTTVVYDFTGEGGVMMGMYNTDEVQPYISPELLRFSQFGHTRCHFTYQIT